MAVWGFSKLHYWGSRVYPLVLDKSFATTLVLYTFGRVLCLFNLCFENGWAYSLRFWDLKKKQLGPANLLTVVDL